MHYQDVIDFWFVEKGEAAWWQKSASFDAEVRTRFGGVHASVVAGEMAHWRVLPEGRLAEIIVLDQFSRNMYRGGARAFACDPLALTLAEKAVEAGALEALEVVKKPFLIMPYMHSESRAVHREAVTLFASDPDMAHSLDFEHRHKAIIDRFGRYPHRNVLLGRESSAEELAFLREPGSSF